MFSIFLQHEKKLFLPFIIYSNQARRHIQMLWSEVKLGGGILLTPEHENPFISIVRQISVENSFALCLFH